jgi:hypothetical protein
VKDQMATQDESSSENCPHWEINDGVQEHVEGQGPVEVADLAANSEEAGAWYYVVDCVTCKAIIPFKHAPEDEPILRFPTMRVRCFQCHIDHRYAAELVSHRRTAPPCRIFKRDRPTHAYDDGPEPSLVQQEDRGVRHTGERVALECETDPVGSSLQRDNIESATVNGRSATIFFLSSFFFAAGWVLHLALDFFYPVQLAVLDELRSAGLAMLLSIACSGTVLLGLVLLIFGTCMFFVEACGFKRHFDTFMLRTFYSRLGAGRIAVAPAFPVARLVAVLGGFFGRRRR